MDHFYDTVPGWFDFDDLYREQVEKAPSAGARFVEVGAWFGRSAAFMAVEIVRSGKDIEFYAVDTWRGSYNDPTRSTAMEHGGSVRKVFDDHMKRGGVEHVVRALERESVDAAATFAEGSLDFVFIDATHDYEHVRADILAWLPKIRPGGVLSGHDVGAPRLLDGVHSVINPSEIRIQRSSWVHAVPC